MLRSAVEKESPPALLTMSDGCPAAQWLSGSVVEWLSGPLQRRSVVHLWCICGTFAVPSVGLSCGPWCAK